jgi:hypothetical protein
MVAVGIHGLQDVAPALSLAMHRPDQIIARRFYHHVWIIMDCLTRAPAASRAVM